MFVLIKLSNRHFVCQTYFDTTARLERDTRLCLLSWTRFDHLIGLIVCCSPTGPYKRIGIVDSVVYELVDESCFAELVGDYGYYGFGRKGLAWVKRHTDTDAESCRTFLEGLPKQTIRIV
jgi:hypothetical protein